MKSFLKYYQLPSLAGLLQIEYMACTMLNAGILVADPKTFFFSNLMKLNLLTKYALLF